MYTEDTKVSELTVKELKEIIRSEIVSLVAPSKNFYDYSKVYTTTKTEVERRPVYPDPLSEPYCQDNSSI